MATHTLGPWIAGNLDGGPLAGREDEICVTTESGAVICTVWPMGEDFDLDESPERDANAILIASAPLLQEHVRILREALAAVLPYATSRAEDLDEAKQNGNEDPKYPGADAAWKACENAEAALEATKEGA